MEAFIQSIYSLCPQSLAGRISIGAYAELPSTNSHLKALARQGAAEGTAIIAQRQTAGRGRLGRSFYSPDESGLYISVLLRPQLKAENAVNITAMTAVAAAKAIERIAPVQAGIKWVNDIFVDGKKVCGILCESSFAPNGYCEYVVIGVGINICAPADGFPAEISGIAGALLPGICPQDTRAALAAAFLEELFIEYAGLASKAFLVQYRQRSIVLGRSISVITPSGAQNAQALAIDDACRLIVRYDDGRRAGIATGEISIRLL